MRLNNGLDSTRQLTSVTHWHGQRETVNVFWESRAHVCVKHHTLRMLLCTAGQLIWAAGWKPFVKVVWGCIVDFPLSRLLSQVLLFLPISCVNSIWSVRGWLRAVRACYEYPRQRRDVGMLGYGGGVWQLCVFACEKGSMCTLTRPKMPYTPWMWSEGSTQVAVLWQLQKAC